MWPTLGVLFAAPFGRHLVFKGGTSLSKVWRAIRRFSGDIDITYDIRGFAADLVGDAGGEALPPTRGQEKRWTKVIRPRCARIEEGQRSPDDGPVDTRRGCLRVPRRARCRVFEVLP